MVGQRIRYYRKTKGLTQEELAQGICSVSYLSKIEKGDAKSSEEVINMLCERLGISPEEVDESKILEMLNEWNMMMVNRQFEEAINFFPKVESKIDHVTHPEIMITFNLYLAKYYMVKDLPELEKANLALEKVKKVFDQLTQDQKFNYFLLQGMHYNYSEKYNDALQFLKLAEGELGKSLNIIETEIAILYYLLALTYNFLMRINSVTTYAFKAISIFDKEYNYSRSADCQVLLAISYRRAKNYDLAEYHLNNALKYSKSFKDEFMSGVIYHNLGYVTSCKNEHLKAIDYFKKSLEYRNSQTKKRKALTLFLLATEYLKLKDYKRAEEYVEEGYKYSNNDLEVYYHLKVLQYQINENYDAKFESLISKDVISFFENRSNWEYVAKYSELLADVYFDQALYKKASTYYRIANNARKNIV
ncbi:tetratricopeptide repeat protein [Fictibacillus sp. UD]|uniref:tetratricopeptide repeat protein n=1 Tax=Fictibacillus sp. UD TaxID=3038777 RepID=UPI0037465079